MRYFLGLDVSDATTNLCFIDEKGKIVHEAVVPTTPQDIESKILSTYLPVEKIGIETGAKSNFLVRSLSFKYAIECYDACKIAKFISMKINKTDKNDARIIAEVTRLL